MSGGIADGAVRGDVDELTTGDRRLGAYARNRSVHCASRSSKRDFWHVPTVMRGILTARKDMSRVTRVTLPAGHCAASSRPQRVLGDGAPAMKNLSRALTSLPWSRAFLGAWRARVKKLSAVARLARPRSSRRRRWMFIFSLITR